MARVVVAYEPVWAIGTGKTATAEDAQAMHAEIRNVLKMMGAPAEEISVLYGGSVKADNAAALFSEPDIDGGLIGGASLRLKNLLVSVGHFRRVAKLKRIRVCMDWMETLVVVVHVVIAVALVGVVLIQQGKGADAGAAFGGSASQTVFGSQGSGSFLTRVTTLMAVVFLSQASRWLFCQATC